MLKLTEDLLKTITEDEFLVNNEDNIYRLENIKSKLKNKKYTISVIAAMKARKSTTLNVFIARDLLTNERAACTDSIIEIKHNKEENNYIEKIFTYGRKEIIKRINGKILEEVFHEDVRNSRK